MTSVFSALFSHAAAPSPWLDNAPVREELFGIERLEQHAYTLAAAQPISSKPPAVLSLHRRLNDNAKVLLAAYRASAAELANGRGVVPAAEWLLDNYHLVEEQIREIRDDLPPGYYRQPRAPGAREAAAGPAPGPPPPPPPASRGPRRATLPRRACRGGGLRGPGGPFAGYPRVFGVAWAFVAHTDSRFDPEMLRRFVRAYQRVQPLTIGELWAVAITLRIVLVENLRRGAKRIVASRAARQEADALADRLLGVNAHPG